MTASTFSDPQRAAGLLRRLLVIDAATCVAMAALLGSAAAPLSGLLGLSPGLLHGAAVLLLPCALLMLLAARVLPARPGLARLVVAGNGAWVLASLAVAFVLQAPTPMGLVFVLAQAGVVALLAAGEARALAALASA